MPGLERAGQATGPIVRGFDAGGSFLIGEQAFRAVLLTTELALAWQPPPLAELTEQALEPALASAPEFLLLGTGPRLVFPPRALVAVLEARGIGLEAMDSRAAARAWALLRSEGRWLAAALMPLAEQRGEMVP